MFISCSRQTLKASEPVLRRGVYMKRGIYIFAKARKWQFYVLNIRNWYIPSAVWGCWLRSAIQRLASSQMCWPTAIIILNKMAVRLTANWSLFSTPSYDNWPAWANQNLLSAMFFYVCWRCQAEIFICIPPQKLFFTLESRMLLFINTHKNETYATLSHRCQGFIH